MEKDEKLIFKFTGNEVFLPKMNKTIQYYFIATEPEYSIYNTYPDEMEGESDENDFHQEEYIGRLSYINIKSELEYDFSCPGDNCNLCKRESNNYCVVCNYKYSSSNTNGKSCYEKETDLIETTIITTEPVITTQPIITTEPIMTEPISEQTTQILTQPLTEKLTEKITEKLTEKITEEIKKDENSCTKQEILNNRCSEGSVTEEQANQLYIYLKEDYLKNNFTRNNTIIQTQNVVFQLSTLKSHNTLADQKNSDNPNVSSIDLGECEKALKDEYGITEDLIVFKTDIKSEDLTQTYVQYEIYDPRDLKMLNLTICKDMKISVSTPVKLDSSTSSLYDLLKDSGYDLFNESSDFYTDICSTFTSQNGTDMTLEDRKKEIFSTSANLSLCQSGCELESYNSTTRKAKCECSPQTEKVEISLSSSSDKFDVKMVGEGFMNTLKNSNFLVLKCYKLAIDLTTLWTNKGRILMTIILLLTIIVLIAFSFTGNKKIDYYLNSIISFKMNKLKNKEKINSKDKKDINIKQKNNKDKEKNTKKNKKNEENILSIKIAKSYSNVFNSSSFKFLWSISFFIILFSFFE